MSGYCDIAPGHPLHGPYHDSEYGFPARDETVLFERLVLEIFQAGLSWLLVLRRRPDFNAALAGFDVDRVARFGAKDIERLLADPRVIRNRLKLEAIVENARRIKALRQSHGGFAAWLDSHHPLSKAEWVKLFRKNFKFTGGEITGEFLMSLGYLPGAHRADCPVMKKIARARSAHENKPAQSAHENKPARSAQKDKPTRTPPKKAPAPKKSPGRKAAQPK